MEKNQQNEKLNILFDECIEQLKTVGINIEEVGKIDIVLNTRTKSIYGRCSHTLPDITSKYIEIRKRRKYIKYAKYLNHKIEISSWVMNLTDKVIKNTIMHEIIHCIPECNNHGTKFKMIAKYINDTLGYNISRLGDKEKDYSESNVEYKKEVVTYNYMIKCEKCGKIFYRKRLKKDFFKKYRCSKCLGKLKLI